MFLYPKKFEKVIRTTEKYDNVRIQISEYSKVAATGRVTFPGENSVIGVTVAPPRVSENGAKNLRIDRYIVLLNHLEP